MKRKEHKEKEGSGPKTLILRTRIPPLLYSALPHAFLSHSKFSPYTTMPISPSSLAFLAVFSLLFASSVHAQPPAPSPTSDGTSIDQGIAYVLMLLALVLTYLIHPLDASSYTFF